MVKQVQVPEALQVNEEPPVDAEMVQEPDDDSALGVEGEAVPLGADVGTVTEEGLVVYEDKERGGLVQYRPSIDEMVMLDKVIIGGKWDAVAGDRPEAVRARLLIVSRKCAALGVDMSLSPYLWATIRGELVLMPTKHLGEQLRAVHGISVEPVEEWMDDELGIYYLKLKGTAADGRVDYDVSIVQIGAKVPGRDEMRIQTGEVLGNTIKVAWTQAKNRLSQSMGGGVAAPVGGSGRAVGAQQLEGADGRVRGDGRAEEANLPGVMRRVAIEPARFSRRLGRKKEDEDPRSDGAASPGAVMEKRAVAGLPVRKVAKVEAKEVPAEPSPAQEVQQEEVATSAPQTAPPAAPKPSQAALAGLPVRRPPSAGAPPAAPPRAVGTTPPMMKPPVPLPVRRKV